MSKNVASRQTHNVFGNISYAVIKLHLNIEAQLLVALLTCTCYSKIFHVTGLSI